MDTAVTLTSAHYEWVADTTGTVNVEFAMQTGFTYGTT